MIEFIIGDGKTIKLSEPTSLEHIYCTTCGGKDGFTCQNEPRKSPALAWFCSNLACMKKSANASKELARQEFYKKLNEWEEPKEKSKKKYEAI